MDTGRSMDGLWCESCLEIRSFIARFDVTNATHKRHTNPNLLGAEGQTKLIGRATDRHVDCWEGTPLGVDFMDSSH